MCFGGKPGEMRMQVVRILDGDTFHGRLLGGVLPRKVRWKQDSMVSVRLLGIDAPERGQPWGDSSRAALERRIQGRTVSLVGAGVDPWGRLLSTVLLEGEDINAHLVATGQAWMFRRYSHSVVLDSLEAFAKSSGLGLWSLQHPIPPWDWRKSNAGRRR